MLIIFFFVDLPAGFYSDDECVSEEDEKDDVVLPTRRFQGVQPPPASQDISKQSVAKNTSKSSFPTAFQWTRDSCAFRAPGTDPMKIRKELVTASERRNTGKESGVKNPAAVPSGTNTDSLDDGAPFGVPCRHRAKVQADAANWAWVEQVLKLKSQESRAPQGSLEV